MRPAQALPAGRVFGMSSVAVAGGLCLLAAPALVDEYSVYLISVACVSVVNAVALTLVFGYTGQVSIGQAAFYAVGAYVAAYLEARAGMSFWMTLPIAAVAGFALAFLVGLPTLRLRDHVLALATLGLGLIAFTVLSQWTSVTGGDQGLGGFTRPSVFGSNDETRFYYVVVAIALALVALAVLIVRSRFGIALRSIREDEVASRSLGVPTHRYKVLIFALAGGMTAVAGTLNAHLLLYLTPQGFGLSESIAILAAVVIGGMGSIWGGIVGGVFVAIVPTLLFSTAEYATLTFGCLMGLVVLVAPGGIVGLAKRAAASALRLQRRRTAPSYPGEAP